MYTDENNISVFFNDVFCAETGVLCATSWICISL